MADFTGVIDQGSTSMRFLAFDRDGRTVASAQKEEDGFFRESVVARRRVLSKLALAVVY